MAKIHVHALTFSFFAFTIATGLTGCFGSTAEEAGDEVQPDTKTAPAEATPAEKVNAAPATQPAVNPALPAAATKPAAPAAEPAADMAEAPPKPTAENSKPVTKESVLPAPGAVWYVKGANTRVYDQAGEKAKVIGKLQKGDHILIKSVQGAWIEMDDGHFMKLAGLTSEPVGRPTRDGVWKK